MRRLNVLENKKLRDRILDLNKDIIICPAREEDAERFITLMNSHYTRQKDPRYFTWQFFSYPKSVYLGAYHQNTLIGGYGAQVHQICTPDRVIRCTKLLDLIVDVSYRNRGLCTLLEAECRKWAEKQMCHVIVTFPNRDTLGILEGTGYRSIPVSHLTLSNTQIGDTLTPFSATQKQHHHNARLVFEKTSEFRKWRFDDNPEYSYSYVYLGDDFTVTKLFIDPVDGTRFGDIVDFQCDLNDEEKIYKLFSKTSLYLKGQGVNFITTWALPHTPLYELLHSLGFSQLTQRWYFCIKVLDPTYEELNDFSRWCLTQADSEIF